MIGHRRTGGSICGWKARIAAGLFLLLAPALGAEQSNAGNGTTSSPEDDLGTLPSSAGSGPGLRSPEDDLGTLPVSHGPDQGPSVTFIGPRALVQGLLPQSPVGGSTSDPSNGGVVTEPGPAPGQIEAHLVGDQLFRMRLDDPRLAQVRFSVDMGNRYRFGRVRLGGHSSNIVTFAAGVELDVPLRALSNPGLLAGRPLAIDLVTVTGELTTITFLSDGLELLVYQDAH